MDLEIKNLEYDEETATSKELDYHSLNAQINLLDDNGKLQIEKDKEAARQYFIQNVNRNTVFFHDLEEKLEFLVNNGYYEKEILDQYNPQDIKNLFKRAYSYKFRFQTFIGAFKYYNQYTLKTFDGKRYLERYEDRVVMNALYLGGGDLELATNVLDEIITGRYQPATPTFLNAGKKQRGEPVSCYLLRVEDNMESIGRTINSALQLSKRGGGVGINLTNLRETGSPIKKVENQSSGIVPVMKILEDSFSYANQLGARQGAGAVYLNVHHPDILEFLDTKRENADEKIRIKTLSLGLIIPDITFQLAKKNEDMYLFSPYDIKKEYGTAFSDISITEKYYEMIDNPNIRKKKISARKLFSTIAEIQFESGYPFLMYEDTVNKANNIHGKVSMSNLCSEILQVNTPSEYNPDGSYKEIGRDISCNLGSLNVAKAFNTPDFEKTIDTVVRSLTNVSDFSNIDTVPSIKNGNDKSHAIGLGQMNLHGFLASNRIFYDSAEAVDFTNLYFYTVRYYAMKASNKIAKERNEKFYEFEKSKYATGEFFDKYIDKDWSQPRTVKVKELFDNSNLHIPTVEDWKQLKEDVMRYGMYNAYLMAVAPTGSIGYISNSTASIHPVTAPIEKRKEGIIGRIYNPAYGLNNDNIEYYKDAYSIGPNPIIDIYAAATEHTDQGLSLTLFFPNTATTRDLNKAYIYAFSKGIKTIYYIRIKQKALDGTEIEDASTYCESCML